MDSVTKWLEDNPFGIALGATCGVLVLLLVGMMVVSSLSSDPATAEFAVEEADANIELPQMAENQPIETYSIITERPLFNETRLPVMTEMGDSGLLAEDEGESNLGAPEVELAGVVITPSLRMVTLRRKDSDVSLVAFEGKPIEADFGSWQVSRIDARAATLKSASGEELQLEMKVHDERIEAPAPIEPPQKEEQASATSAEEERDSESAPLSRAEEIRQRIEERREELRREAEAAEQGGSEPQEASYENAIQSLIRGGRKNQTNKENEQ